MVLNLIDSFGASGVSYGLYTKQADVIDTEYLSRYFVVSEFNSTFTAGKNSISINGSPFLLQNSQIYIECLDIQGNNLFIEMAKYSDDGTPGNTYKEGTATVISIHVYGDTSDGVGRIIIYGTLTDGRSVKWIQNVIINKTLVNNSRVRFYQTPSLQINSVTIPVLSSSISKNLINYVNFTGDLHGIAVTPPQNTNLSNINKRNTNIDYRLILNSSGSFNYQMIGSNINLNINKVTEASNTVDTNITTSYVITDVINSTTLKISTPYYYKDNYRNNIITNIVDADGFVQYPFINYNTSKSYQTIFDGSNTYILNQSYADITYKNLRTFSGYVGRYKIYRKSLLSCGDFSVIAEGDVKSKEILADTNTQNSFYNNLGKFYNQEHINYYWFTSSNDTTLSYSPDYSINSMYVSSTSSGSDYVIVKSHTSDNDRNSTYIPFDITQSLLNSGSAYDSNFISLFANTQYKISISAVIKKLTSQTSASLSFYFTSSILEASQEPTFTNNFGIKLTELSANTNDSTVDFSDSYTFYTPQNDLHGTLVIVSNLCNAYIKEISFKTYGDYGFSPDVFVTRIPWPVTVANESFKIKSELFDINNQLIYSDFNSVGNFDPDGTSLIIPVIISGSIPTPTTHLIWSRA